MLKSAFTILVSIRAKLLFSFLIIGLIVIAMGHYANRGIQEMGGMVIQTYDGPVQASTHAESARYLFSRIEALLLTESLRSEEEHEHDTNWSEINSLLNAFSNDMQVVASTHMSPQAKPYIIDTINFIQNWKIELENRNPEFDGELYNKYRDSFQHIYTNLNAISDLQVTAGLIERSVTQDIIRQRVSNITLFIGSALILALTLALWLSMTILNPLKTAVDIANKVSGGDYDVTIPKGHKDETGLLLNSMAIMQGNIRKFIARERNEKEMAKDYLAAALVNSKDAILITNSDEKITIANERVKTLFPHLIDDDFIGDDLNQYFNHAGHPKKGIVPNPSNANEIQLETGVWTKIDASDMEEGGRLFIWTDITELKNREVTLRIAKEKAEAADKAKTLFLASMSHELRTPLNAVIGFSDLMANETFGPLGNPEYTDLSQHILQSGESLLRMIEDILVIAGTRNETQATLDFKDENLIALIDTALDTIREDCETKNIGILWAKPDYHYNIYCNAQRLSRVFDAILSNAVKFNKKGGFIKVNVKTPPETYGKSGVFIDITDTGVGISKSDMPQIMAPFGQADTSYSRANDGAGLGLALAKKWTKLHNGTISVASKLDQGTVVRIFLPATIQAASDIQDVSKATAQDDDIQNRLKHSA